MAQSAGEKGIGFAANQYHAARTLPCGCVRRSDIFSPTPVRRSAGIEGADALFGGIERG
jgi:hypothetical protein